MKDRYVGYVLCVVVIFAAMAGKPLALDQQPGWLLVAAPSMSDPRFAGTVIFILHHGDDGTKGVIVNRLISTQPAGEVMEQMLGAEAPLTNGPDVRIQFGGPVRTTRWTYVHSNDYAGPNTTTVTARVSITSNANVLAAVAQGKGPAHGFLAIGYAGWGPGQLAKEMARKDWIAVPTDSEIVLDGRIATKWRRALDRRGVDL